MSEEEKDAGGVPESQTSGETQETNPDTSGGSEQPETQSKNDSVSYDSYRKVLDEKKKREQRLKELEEQINQREQEKLESEGKKDELIEQLRSQIKKKDETIQNRVSKFVHKSLQDEVKSEADKMGCIDSDLVTKVADLNQIDMDEENLTADKDHIKMVLEQVKEERPFLFGTKAPSVNTSTPKTEAPEKKQADLKEKSVEELKKMAAQLEK